MMRGRSAVASLLPASTSVVLYGVFLLGTFLFCQENQILVTKGNGSELRIPTTGPLADSNAQAVAKHVRSFDAEVRTDTKRWDSSTQTTNQNPEVLAAIWQTAVESRDEAVDQLDLAYRIAEETSAGSVDPKLVDQARQKIDRAREIMSSPPPPTLFVHTEIAAGVNSATLHYMAMADYKRQSTSWVSYDFGTSLRIGLYMFRLDAPNMGKPYREEVLVLAEPTKHKIVPLPK